MAVLPPPGPTLARVQIANATQFARVAETVAVRREQLAAAVASFDPATASVYDDAGAAVLSQWVDDNADGELDELVFQLDLAPGAQRVFTIAQVARVPATGGEYTVYGRFVRERFDDFAWENDRIAARMYGVALETAPKDPLVSSGVDAWVKKDPRGVINEWFLTGNYHDDLGQGGDFYSVGKTRGCGGLGIWANDKLFVSKNHKASRVIASGPLRLIFELEYDGWFAGGRRVSEVKRVQLDAGSSFNLVQSKFTGVNKNTKIAVGIAKHEGSLLGGDAAGWMRTWEPLNGGKNGHLGCAVVLPPGTPNEQKIAETDYLLISSAPAEGAFSFRSGWVWDGNGAITDATAWDNELRAMTAKAVAPVTVTLAAAAAPVAPAAPVATAPAPSGPAAPATSAPATTTPAPTAAPAP
jgi:hypothetical protein